MNVKLNPVRTVEFVQILLPIIPVSVLVNLWEETANTVSIVIILQIYLYKFFTWCIAEITLE